MSPPTVKSFLATLKRRLDQLSADELQAALLHYARDLDPWERAALLESFAPPSTTPAKPALKKNQGRRLLEEIRAFATRVEAGEYSDGWGWDDAIREERLFGDESWIDEVDAYLAGAHELLDGGAWVPARDAYQSLFEAVRMGFDDAQLPGEEEFFPPNEAFEEEAYRYLRAVYLTAEPGERPEVLLAGFQVVWGLVFDAGLEGMLEVSDEELPDLEAFAEAWITFLEGAEAHSPEAELRREAARVFHGAEGLAALARRGGQADPEAYVAWVVHLWTDGKTREVVEAAWEALEALPRDLGVRAKLADVLRCAATGLGDAAAVDRARYEAFSAEPTLVRLLCWIEGAADAAEHDRRLAQAGTRLKEIDADWATARTPLAMQEHRFRSRAEPGLRWYVQLLRGEYAAVGKALDLAPPLGWSSSDHPGPLAVPFFLAASGGLGTRGKLGPNLGALWGPVASLPMVHDDAAKRGADRPERDLGLHLAEALQRFPLDDRAGARCFQKAERAALARVDAIVSEKHRRRYGDAANLLHAVADGYCCLGLAAEAARLVARYRERYPRHRAFLAELKSTAKLASAPGH